MRYKNIAKLNKIQRLDIRIYASPCDFHFFFMRGVGMRHGKTVKIYCHIVKLFKKQEMQVVKIQI